MTPIPAPSSQPVPALAVAALVSVLQRLPGANPGSTAAAPGPTTAAPGSPAPAPGSVTDTPGPATPAELTLKAFFARHPAAGRGDRQRISDRVFLVLRHLRLLQWLADQDPAGQPPAANTSEAARVRAARLLTLAESALTQPGAMPVVNGAVPAPIAFSLPDWLWQGLCEAHGEVAATDMAGAMLQPSSIHLRVNLLRARPQEVRSALARAGIDAQPVAGVREALVVQGRPALEPLAPFVRGEVEVQDLGSQALARFCNARRGQFVVDLCAGAGGKSLALASAMRNQGNLLACDVDGARLALAEARLARAGVTIARTLRIGNVDDGRLEKYRGRADMVLVDAPCSGTGTLQRHPDLKWRSSAAGLASFVDLQRRLLMGAARLLRPGGVLVYGTCSLLEAENDAQSRWAAGHPLIGGRSRAAPVVGRWLPSGSSIAGTPITGGYFAAKWHLDAHTE